MAPRGRIYLKQYNKQRSSAANAATHTSKVAHSPCAPVPLSMHGSIIVNKRRAIRDNRYYSKRTSGTQVSESRPPIPVQLCTHRFVAWAAVACCKLEQLSGQRFSWPATSCCSSAPQHEVRPPIIDAPYVLERFCMQHPAKSARSKSDLREFAGNFRIWFEGRRELRLWQTTPGSPACVLRLPYRAVRPLRALFCGHSRLLSLCKQVVWCLKSVHRRFPRGILLVSRYVWCLVLIRCRPLRFAEHCRCDWAATGPDRTVGEPAERAWVASARPRASSRKGVLHRMAAKCLRAGGAALRPDHCPAFLPVASRKCFGMLPTSQNRCGVFAGIGAILTRRQKTAIVRDDFILKPVE
jgi:hypothetical protein